MSFTSFFHHILTHSFGGCSSCGSDVEGGWINHPTFGYIRTCCARAAS